MQAMITRIKVITFHTEGFPHDDGLPLDQSMEDLKALVLSQGCEFEAYTPRKLRALGAEDLVQRYDDKYALPKNPGLHTIGMCAWKPFVLLHALQSMSKNDLVIYTDANIGKYPGLRVAMENIPEFVAGTGDVHDFFVGRECEDQRRKVAQHASGRQIVEIGGNTVFSCNFPMHIVNRIVSRNTPAAKEILLYWLALCRVQKFILPPLVGDHHEEYRWFCPEQSVLNLILANLIEEGQLPYYYSTIGFDRAGRRFVGDNSHLSCISAPIGRPHYIPFRQRFAKEIAEAELYAVTRMAQPLPVDGAKKAA